MNTTNVRIDPNNSAMSLSVATEGFIWNKVFTQISTPEMSGYIPYIGNAQTRNFNAVRAPGERDAHEIRIEIQSSSSYSISDYDLSISLTDGEIRRAQPPFNNFNQINSLTLGNARNIKMEHAVSALLGSTSVLTNYVTPATKWTDASSDVMGEITTGIQSVILKTGKVPKHVATSDQIIRTLQHHPQFVNRINGITKALSYNGVIDLLKAEFGFTEIYVSTAIYDSAVLGQTASNAFIFGKDFVIYYKGQVKQMEPTLGIDFSYNCANAREGIAQSQLLNTAGTPIGLTWTNYWSRGLTVCMVDAGYLLNEVIA